MADSGGRTVSRRPRRRGTFRHASRRRSFGAALAGAALASTALAACGSSGGGTGPVTINFYSFNDPSGAVATAVTNCTKASGGKYTITYNKLPAAADDQRLQMARRLAAADPTMDILGLDVTWEAEFAEAGWILPWTGTYKEQAETGTLKVPLETATWKGKLVAVPYNSNTQLLWYRSDLVKTPPKTWDEMISDAEQLAKQGKPHLIEIQGAQYEGVTVWFNTLVASAGGSILTPDSSKANPGQPWLTALGTMKKLGTSVAADPSLGVQMEDQNRLAMEAGTAAFELNYPFVYPSMKADNPEMFKHFKWALYPGVMPGEPAHVTIGGIDIAISKYSPHPDLAFQAALCLRDKQNQLNAAVKGGLPPTLESLYHDPAMFPDYPFHADILTALQQASVRPKTPAYQSVSIVISHSVSPPAGIDPPATEQAMTGEINEALQSKLVIP
ncbi:MAG TPA: ABC transporter substrate-binding protein [Streptosporangiaceae bacterium]|nr:ABC transporter substrate-binding protein [Streptosporangiaceae bacterium]